MSFFSVFLLVVGCALRFYVGRRKFYRRNVAGVEEFSGYGKAVATSVIEGVMQVVGNVSIFFGVLGLIVSLLA